jgi:hypothetical protein
MTSIKTRTSEDICELGEWLIGNACLTGEGSRKFLETILDWIFGQIWIRTFVGVTCRCAGHRADALSLRKIERPYWEAVAAVILKWCSVRRNGWIRVNEAAAGVAAAAAAAWSSGRLFAMPEGSTKLMAAGAAWVRSI